MLGDGEHPLAAAIVADAEECEIQLSPMEATSPIAPRRLLTMVSVFVAGPRRRVSFHSQFFAPVRASAVCIRLRILSLLPPAFPVWSRFEERLVK